MEYEDRIFDNSYVHTIDIQISEDDWEDLKLNALYKEAYDCTVIIDGETFHHVGVRTKGNVTLIQSIVREWDRYSLVLDFGAFQPSQRYYGLDKLSLNNNICDSSFIRDYLCYLMFPSVSGKRNKPSQVIYMTEAEKRMKRCCFTGHRPSKLKQDEQTVKRSLAAAIDQAIARGFTTFITGMAQGTDIWAAEIVLDRRIQYVIVCSCV